MRRFTLVFSLLVGLAAFVARPSQAAISLDFNIHVGDHAPVGYFHQQPVGYLVPSSNVYWYDNAGYDCYRYGNAYYVNDGGYWYASRSWRGPFIGVRYASVPTQILRVPTRYRHQPRGYWQTAQRPTWGNDSRWRGDRSDRNWSRNQEQSRWSNDRNDRDDRRWSSREGDRDDNGKWKNGKGHGKGHDKNKGNKGNGKGRGHS